MGKIQSEVKVKSKLLENKNAPTFLRASAKGSFSGDSLSVLCNAKIQKNQIWKIKNTQNMRVAHLPWR